jgi:hypothetical protein
LTNQSNQSLTSRSLPSSCPRYSDLHRGLSPRPSIYPIHLSGSPTSNPSARSIDQSVPINQSSASLSLTQCPIGQSFFSITLTHSLNLSIHPSTAACAPSIDVVSSRRLAAINRSVNPSISSINHHQPECDRRLRLRQSVDQSVRSIDHAIDQSTNQPIASAPAHHIQSIDH